MSEFAEVFAGARGFCEVVFQIGQMQKSAKRRFALRQSSKTTNLRLGRWRVACPGFPNYWEYSRLSSLAIPLWRLRIEPRLPDIAFRWAKKDDLPDIAGCLQRNYQKLQFAPYITADELANPKHSPGLSAQDFLLAIDRKGKVKACVALWDQQSFKQLVVENYRGNLKRFRGLVNLVGPLLGIPHLPDPGSMFRFAYLSHMAAPIDDRLLWLALMARACNAARARKFKYVSLGMSQCHPQLKSIKFHYRHIDYRSILYTVHWGEDASQVKALDSRIPHVEIAML